jgi:alkylated DNA nucleotide flippase Atl1
MNSTPSLRFMWSVYKQLLVEEGRTSRREQRIAQAAFYSGARCVLKVLDHLAQNGEVEELQRVVRRHGRSIRRLQGREPRKRRH